MIMLRKQITFVIVGNLNIDVELVKVIDIEENQSGDDVMTFEWDGIIRQSLIYTKIMG
jgi:hypothetical protein